MDRGAWWATVHKVAKTWTRLSDFAHTRRGADRDSTSPGEGTADYHSGHVKLFV